MKRGEEKPVLVLHSQNTRAEKGMFGGFSRNGSRYPKPSRRPFSSAEPNR